MLSMVYACAVWGLEGAVIQVEVDFNPYAGVPMFTIVGLPDSAVKESRDRVRAAIKNSRLQFPNKGYVVNLSPADLPKHGPAYDLAIAVGVLASTDQIAARTLEGSMFIGELSLDGTVRHVNSVMSMVYTAQRDGFQTVYVPEEDAPQAALVGGVAVIPVRSLGQLVEHAYGLNPIPVFVPNSDPQDNSHLPDGLTDFADVRGQEHAKRVLEIAAAGNHNVLMQGPPGVGKSLLSRALPGILPRLTQEEALEVTRIYSTADMLDSAHPLIRARPFRAPHHTVSTAGLVGGGAIPRPGEISLAHRGVLFLDEFTEYGARALEVLRQPLEDKIVTISRAQGSLTFPANFLLIAAMNPCPCGYYGDTQRPCTCSPATIQRYQSKISGPMLDRIDIHLDVRRVEHDKLMSAQPGEPSASVRVRVERARGRQQERFKTLPGVFTNSDIPAGQVITLCRVEGDARKLMDVAVQQMHLSARAYHRLLKLSRTIADLEDCEGITSVHVAEALQYRPRAKVM